MNDKIYKTISYQNHIIGEIKSEEINASIYFMNVTDLELNDQEMNWM